MPQPEQVERPPIPGKKAHDWRTYKVEIGRSLAGPGFSSGLGWIVAGLGVLFPFTEERLPRL
jgi:hypothetical protein